MSLADIPKGWMPKGVAVLDGDPDYVKDRIAAAYPDLALLDAAILPLEEIAVIAFDPGDAIAAFAGAAWVHCGGAGVDRLVSQMGWVPALLTRTVGDMGRQMAEYVLAHWLEDLQRLPERRERQAAGAWDKAVAPAGFLHDKAVVIFGTGAIGREMARALGALGVRCHGVSRSGTPVPGFETVSAFGRLPRAVADAADGVILCLPATAETRGLIDRQALSGFSGVRLFNVGRGEAIDEGGLVAAIEAGHVRRAVLDVFAVEPLPPGSPLWRHEAVRITPHIAGNTKPRDVADAFLAALEALRRGAAPDLLVDIGRGY